jgi:hypothetical protein
LKYSSSVAWNSSQWPGESFSASSQPPWLTGASPNHTVAWAFAAGEMM